ncbi:AI-2E family transporter [Rhizobium cremeum]|uniref:AI-2E family transporter n=1 Tax=Rhizobium cremeum TaxID=2813827 RepID=UPI003CC7F213|nr:AI-2E family transporter [Rhizobium cremeum]MCJ8001560.1 AI-2E family transporter [Rhizobium cremeum]
MNEGPNGTGRSHEAMGARTSHAGAARRRPVRRVRVRKTALDLALIWSVIGIFVILAVTAIHLAASVLIPITLAVVVGLILGLAADRLGALGVPPMLSALILTTGFAALIFFIANTLIGPLGELAANAPAMVEQAIERILPYLQRIKWLHINSASFRSGSMSMEALIENSSTVLSTVATRVTPAIVQTLIFFAALVLFLGSRHAIRKTLIIAFRDRARRLAAIRTFNAIEQALGFYFATASLLYAVVGVSMTIIAWAGGLDMPVLWGFFAFLSSFVPFLGVTAMTMALAIAGVIAHDSLVVGLAPATAFFAVHMVMENLVTPAVMGRRLEINSFAVFVAIIFWTWLWGAIGAMLAVPLSLIAITVASELLPQNRIQPNLPD